LLDKSEINAMFDFQAIGPSNCRSDRPTRRFGERADYIVLETSGANALDFHLAYYLGLLTAADPTGFFHIISKDTGFDPLVRHLKARKLFAARSASIETMPCFPPAAGVAGDPEASGAVPSAPAPPAVADLLERAVADLIKRKAAKPRTTKTLLSTLHAQCGKQRPIAEVEGVYQALVARGYVKVNGTQVSYALPAA